jgi:cobalt/nickel transport protein
MWKPCLAAIVAVLSFSGTALAHFGMLIPSHAVVEDKKDSLISLELSFSHPMEMIGMPLLNPKAFQVIIDGKAEDISSALQAAKIMGHDAWKAQYTIKKPGAHQFVMEPQPYWEAAEDCFIIHYTKTYVAAFGEEEGWDEPLGLKTEILPLTRPFGNYTGNVFQGQVLLDGKPVPNAAVEVEYYNKDGEYAAPNEYMVSQAVKADADGVFTFGIPFAGWWGFAALNTADETMQHEGKDKDIELGAVIWVEFVSLVKKQ